MLAALRIQEPEKIPTGVSGPISLPAGRCHKQRSVYFWVGTLSYRVVAVALRDM